MLRHCERKTQIVTAGVYTHPRQSALAAPKASRIQSSESSAATVCCPPTRNTCVIHRDSAGDLRKCSRAACREGVENKLKLLSATCKLIPEPDARSACEKLVKVIEAEMLLVCDACQDP